MFDQAIARVGIRYGVICGAACFGLMLLAYFLGYNPLGSSGQLSYIPMPVFIFLALKYFKQFNDTEISFFKGWRVGFSVTFYTALTAALLLFIFMYAVGPGIINEYVGEMREILDTNREEQIKLLGKDMYEQSYAALDAITPGNLAAYDFMGRLFVGALLSVVAAVFFRK